MCIILCYIINKYSKKFDFKVITLLQINTVKGLVNL